MVIIQDLVVGLRIGIVAIAHFVPSLIQVFNSFLQVSDHDPFSGVGGGVFSQVILDKNGDRKIDH